MNNYRRRIIKKEPIEKYVSFELRFIFASEQFAPPSFAFISFYFIIFLIIHFVFNLTAKISATCSTILQYDLLYGRIWNFDIFWRLKIVRSGLRVIAFTKIASRWYVLFLAILAPNKLINNSKSVLDILVKSWKKDFNFPFFNRQLTQYFVFFLLWTNN